MGNPELQDEDQQRILRSVIEDGKRTSPSPLPYYSSSQKQPVNDIEAGEREKLLISSNNKKKKKPGGDKILVLAALLMKVFLILIIGGIVAFVFFNRELVSNWLEMACDWLESIGSWSIILFLAVYTGLSILLFPAELLNLCAGYIFGAEDMYGERVGLAISICLCLTGMTLCVFVHFVLAREVIKPLVVRGFTPSPTLAALGAAVEEAGFKFVFLIRMVPVIPFAVANFGLGFTHISLSSVLLGTIGVLPGTSLVIYLGTKSDNFDELIGRHGMTTQNKIMTCVSIVSFVIALGYISHLTRKKIMERANLKVDSSGSRLGDQTNRSSKSPRYITVADSANKI